MNHTVVVYPGTDSTFFVAPRIKALSNEVNKRFHDLESQMHKTNFDAASVFARLDSVEAEPVRNSGEVKHTYCLGIHSGDTQPPCDPYSDVENVETTNFDSVSNL